MIIYSKHVWLAAIPDWMVVITFRTVGERQGVLSASGIVITDYGRRAVWWDREGKCWSRIVENTRLKRFDITARLTNVAFDK